MMCAARRPYGWRLLQKGNILLLAAEFGSGQVLWSMLWFFLFFVWIMLIFMIFGDIIRSDDMGGWEKAAWSIFIIIVPFFGIFIYLIVRGGSMHERQAEAAAEGQAAQDTYIRNVAGSGASEADQLSTLSDLHTAGKLDDSEYASAKAKVLDS
jgi:hypothetical protein